jgi:hypothetical protein
MSQSLGITGTLRFQPTDAAPPALVPFSAALTFAQRAGFDVVEAGAVANVPVPMGTITKPLLVYIEVYQGTFSLCTAANGTNPIALSVDASPAPADKATLILVNPSPQAMALYLTTPGPAAGRIWVFG